MNKLLAFFCIFFVFITGSVQASLEKPVVSKAAPAKTKGGNYPGRKVYAHVPYIEMAVLHQKRKDIVVVDVRSDLEFDTLRIKGAKHISLGSTDFVKHVKELRESTKKPIVFYCNGHTCYKSYKATDKAMAAKIDKVYAFDAGVFDWAKAHPTEAELLGQSPVNPKSLISKQALKARMISPDDFAKKVGPNAVVVDVRSRLQRNATGLFPFDEQWASMNDKKALDRSIAKAKREGKPLLAYDSVGKQVRWLQYYLEKRGLRNYYFMKGGSENYYKMLFARDGHNDIYNSVMTEGLRKKKK